MDKIFFALALAAPMFIQDIAASKVPSVVRDAFYKKYTPGHDKVSWEKEKGNYEANWGGKSGEDNAAQFTPTGTFVEYAQAIPMDQLPSGVLPYVKGHYTSPAREAAKVTNAAGVLSYEVEIKGKDLVFDAQGNFVKEEKE